MRGMNHKGKFGDQANAWKGDDTCYAAKHKYLVLRHGKADHCSECGDRTKAKRYEWANISGKYERDISDYRPLCPSCHRKLDYGNFCKHGHEFTPENTMINAKGHRTCKKCHCRNSKKSYEIKKLKLSQLK